MLGFKMLKNLFNKSNIIKDKFENYKKYSIKAQDYFEANIEKIKALLEDTTIKNIAENLIKKIYIKGIINPKYWYCKDIKEYNSYYSDIESAMQECDYSDYDNDTNEDDDLIYLSDGVWINKEDAWF